MIHTTADKHTPARQIPVVDTFRRFISWIGWALAADSVSRQKVEDAHAARCTLASFSDAEFQDSGIDPSDATAVSSWQSDLPFFMQGGFGRK